MSKLLMGTNWVSMDEPAYSLKEVNLPTPDSKGVHRYQCIRVIRNGGDVTELRRDLGAAKKFKVQEFVIPGGVVDPISKRMEILHTVGELYDIAEYLRQGPYRAPEAPAAGDLIGRYHDQPDKRRRAARKLSQFGRLVKTQRD